MSRAIDAPFHEAASRLDSIRAMLTLLESIDVRRDPRAETALAVQKAGVYVWLGACVEDFLRQFLVHLLRDITAGRPRYSDLRVELLAVAGGVHFERLQALRQLKKWRDRVAVLRHVVDVDEAVLSDTHLPLDGRTIEPEHLEIVWLVFAMPHAPFPGPLQKMALLDVARGRNQVAHGELRPEDLGRSKTIGDLRRMVGFMEDVVQHVYMCGGEYLDADAFRR
jgi:hypothetical protein